MPSPKIKTEVKLMSEAIIAKKAEQVNLVAEKMKAAASIVVVDSRGLTVEQDTVLRRSLRDNIHVLPSYLPLLSTPSEPCNES